MVKPRSQQSAKKSHDPQAIEKFVNEMADKPYGKEPVATPAKEQMTPVSITLPISMRDELDMLALKHKREKGELRTVSAIVRAALESYLSKS